jgi:hypothetical protein
MKSVLKCAAVAALLFVANILRAQIQFSSTDLTAIESTTPLSADQLPVIGTFYSAANPQIAPAPINSLGYPAWNVGNVGTIEIYLLDDLSDTDSGGGFHAMDDSEPPIPDGGGDGGGTYEFTNTYSFPTNGLWLQITNISNGSAFANLNGATDYVYEIFSTTNLSVALAVSNWDVETEVFPGSSTNTMPFSVSMNGRNPLFLWARDWTGVTSNGNLTPDWWFYYWFGIAGLSLSDDDLDGQGNTMYSDFVNRSDPDIVNFGLSCTNQYFNFTNPIVQLDLVTGTPGYVAALVDDTNQADATWTSYSSSNITVNLGSTEGWHNIYIGLKGFAPTAFQTWETIRLKLDLIQPLIAITNPISGTITQPLIQLQGYSSEALSSISYDLTNGNGLVTNQPVFILGQYYDTNTMELTTNYFQCFDVPVTNGLNVFTLHATDLAGNETTTNFSFTLDYSSVTNPPAIELNWPQNGTRISGSNFTWHGYISEATAQVAAQIVNTNGVTNSVSGQVGRNGDFWIYCLPLSGGSNYLFLSATDAAGNVNTTNIVVTQSSLVLTITSASLGGPVQGTISDPSDYTVWVNGVIATNNGDGTWTAYPNLTVDTPVVQVRAIPNTDNGGYGGGQ